MTSTRRFAVLAYALLMSAGPGSAAEPASFPWIIGHRGLLQHAPENTLAGFLACSHLGFGIEVDVQRTRDGQLVCIHDADVTRTTNGRGLVAELTAEAIRTLDAGSRFDPAFRGQRVPLLTEVLAGLARGSVPVPIALDLKVTDPTLPAEVIRLVRQHGLQGRVLCIGLTISNPALRRQLRAADADVGIAMLAQTAENLPDVLKDTDASGAYLRFIPTAGQVRALHDQKKRVFVVGPTVSGREPVNWDKVRQAGVDALLTDYPLECRQRWRAP